MPALAGGASRRPPPPPTGPSQHTNRATRRAPTSKASIAERGLDGRLTGPGPLHRVGGRNDVRPDGPRPGVRQMNLTSTIWLPGSNREVPCQGAARASSFAKAEPVHPARAARRGIAVRVHARDEAALPTLAGLGRREGALAAAVRGDGAGELDRRAATVGRASTDPRAALRVSRARGLVGAAAEGGRGGRRERSLAKVGRLAAGRLSVGAGIAGRGAAEVRADRRVPAAMARRRGSVRWPRARTP